MPGSPETSRSLLLRVRDRDDQIAWSEFVSIYAPLIHAYARHRGLQDADAADVAQTVLQSIAGAIPGFDYDSSKGTFRGWLFTIARNQVFTSLEKNARLPVATGKSSFHQRLNEQADSMDDEDIWNREHELRLFHWAVDRIRSEFKENTWQAFWRVAVEGEPASEVAVALGMSTGAIYIAKSRVTARLRELIESVEN